MLSLVPQGLALSQWTLGSMSFRSVTMVSWDLHCHNGQLVAWEPAVSQESLSSMRFWTVTVVSLLQRGPGVSRGLLGSVSFHNVPMVSLFLQCHSGLLVP